MHFARHFAHSLEGVGHYSSLVAEGLRPALGYLSALIVLAVAVLGARAFFRIDLALHVMAGEILAWPDFRLADGKLDFTGQMPYVAGDRDVALIVDTSGGTGFEALHPYKRGFLLTATTVHVKTSGRSVLPLSWSALPIRTTRKGLARVLPHLVWPVTILAVLYLLLANSIGKALSVLLLGSLGLLAAGGRGLNYSQTATVAAYALTGPMLLALAKELFFPTALFFTWIYWGFAAGWVVWAVLAVKRDLVGTVRS